MFILKSEIFDCSWYCGKFEQSFIISIFFETLRRGLIKEAKIDVIINWTCIWIEVHYTHLLACLNVFVYPLLTTTKHECLVHILQYFKLSTQSVCLRTPAVWEELYTICLCSVHSLTSTFVVWITPNCGQRRCRFQNDTGSKMSLVQGLQHCSKFRSCMLWQ